jgi:LPXTG-site transpeptidase (sortase) family protein
VRFGVQPRPLGCATLSLIFRVRADSALRAIRHHFAPLLLLTGIAVLGYAGFQYGAMLFEQRRLQARWREQQKISSAGNRHSVAESGLTRISIPSIQFSAIIVEGTDLTSLMIGPGHLAGTAQPGEAGNAVVSAHRDTFFRNIMKLSTGDRIFIERSGQTFTYLVEGFSIVKPTDVSVAAPTGDNRLTLITCDPAYSLGSAPQRLVVISKLVQPITASPSVEKAQQWPPRTHMKQAAIKKIPAGGAAQ